MRQEGANQVLAVLKRLGFLLGFPVQLVDGRWSVVGQILVFEPLPHILHRIEFRRIGGKVVPLQPRGGLDHLFHQIRYMGRQPIPENDDFLSWHLAQQLFEKLLRPFFVHVLSGKKAKQQLHRTAPGGRDHQSGDHRDFLPVAQAYFQHRSLSDRGPGTLHQGRQKKARLVDKDNQRLGLAGFFSKAVKLPGVLPFP